MNGPYLVQMSEAAFADIPSRVVPRTVRLEDPLLEGAKAIAWIFDGYCETLLAKNEGLQELLQRFVGRFDDSKCWSCLTQGQRALHLLGALDGETKCGGLAQFLWNCPDFVFPVSETLSALVVPELGAAYNQALERLIGRQEAWIELRNQSREDPGNFWEPFQASYELLDFSWFDEAYFAKHGPALIAKLVAYVRLNKSEFIELLL